MARAASKIHVEETPWNFRDAKYAIVIIGIDADPTTKENLIITYLHAN